ncbi:pantocin A family RiPP [Actinokineospora auranticolor]|uniref:Pantocin A family RiPP n=1 Tax=Actinokineospora auranticolor TaxID=155976 RepID=A0A2S6GK01_9PSEU|nr:pantocin A family RiPP [Actinokineospora auranticolor]
MFQVETLEVRLSEISEEAVMYDSSEAIELED